LIVAGEVSVDGAIENRKRCKIRSGQKVELENQVILIE